MNIKRYFSLIFLIIVIAAFTASPQETDIIPHLKKIESGEKSAVQKMLPDLKKNHPGDPSIIFLEAVLTGDGEAAVVLYKQIVNKFAESKYADASLFRIYSYYYSLGLYSAAEEYFQNLKENYPNSPYINIAEREIPSKDEAILEERQPEKEIIKEEEIEEKKEPVYIYTIQAGAFSNFANAKGLIKDFTDSGFETELIEKNVGGTIFHVVLVGKFANEEEAKSFLQVINTEFKLEGRIIPLN